MERTRITSKRTGRRNRRRPVLHTQNGAFRLSLHPLFVLVGLWYALQGDLFLFLMSGLVAVQHELAHAFASAKLGYTLRKIVLMPFGAVLEGDLSGITLKDEIIVALYGPLCNLFTAFFFGALWWFYPTVYAYTDTAYSISLSIALVNLLPCYPLDGGRILRAFLTSALYNKRGDYPKAERTAYTVCKIVSLSIGVLLCAVGAGLLFTGRGNISACLFGAFLIVGALQNTRNVSYAKIRFSQADALKRGVETRRIAVLQTCKLKDVFRFIRQSSFLILDVYSTDEQPLFTVTQNELDNLFLRANSPYATLGELYSQAQTEQTRKNEA